MPFRLPDDTVLHPWTLKNGLFGTLNHDMVVHRHHGRPCLCRCPVPVCKDPSCAAPKNGQVVYQTSLKYSEPRVSMGHPSRSSGPKLGARNPLFFLCTAICNAAGSQPRTTCRAVSVLSKSANLAQLMAMIVIRELLGHRVTEAIYHRSLPEPFGHVIRRHRGNTSALIWHALAQTQRGAPCYWTEI